MHTLSQFIFVVLKGAAFGFADLVMAGVIAFSACVLFSRLGFRYTGFWAGAIAILFLGGMLYFDDGQVLMQLSAHTGNPDALAQGVDEADVWFNFTAKAISGVIGIFAGLGFRMRYWPAQGHRQASPEPMENR